MDRLQGLTVLVTGAGRGLGEGISRRLVEHGATVIAVSRTESELEALAAAVGDKGGTLCTKSVDLGKRNELHGLISSMNNEFGGVDVIINNAAILRMKSFDEMTEQEFDETLEVNLMAPTRLIRAFLPEMKRRGRGSIINVTSGAATRGFVNETDYCATKYGIEGFSYSLAIELESDNISVNLVGPGYPIKPTSITTAEFEQWTPEQKSKYRDPIEMAEAFAFLATQYPQKGGVTGKRFNAYELSNQILEQGWDVAV